MGWSVLAGIEGQRISLRRAASEEACAARPAGQRHRAVSVTL